MPGPEAQKAPSCLDRLGSMGTTIRILICEMGQRLDVVERQQAKSASHLFYWGRSLAMLKGPRGRKRDMESAQPVMK